MPRKQVHEIILAATPGEVWRMITEAENITRWFSPEARVEPGKGGKIFLSWGPGMEGEAPIHLWEPNHRFGWTEPGDSPKLIEFEIEAQGGLTKLRLVQSGFGEGASFDDEFESVNGGWLSFLSILKYGIEFHRLDACTPVSVFRNVELTRDQITASVGTAIQVSPLLGQLAAGQPYQAQLGALGPVHGTRLEPFKPGYYVLTLDSWNQSIFAIFAEQAGSNCYFTLQAYLFGESGENAPQLKILLTELTL